MVDVVDGADAVSKLHQIAHDLENIFLAESAVLQRHVELEPMVELEPAHFG